MKIYWFKFQIKIFYFYYRIIFICGGSILMDFMGNLCLKKTIKKLTIYKNWCGGPKKINDFKVDLLLLFLF